MEPATDKDMAWVYGCIAAPIVVVLLAALVGWLI
jgi:hypothetical protein